MSEVRDKKQFCFYGWLCIPYFVKSKPPLYVSHNKAYQNGYVAVANTSGAKMQLPSLVILDLAILTRLHR